MNYIEREDEYDIHPAEEVHQRRLDLEDEEPDILTIEPVKGETGEDGIDSFRMPVLLDISDSESEDDIVAVGPGTMRRKSPGTGRDSNTNTNAATGGESGAYDSDNRRQATVSNGVGRAQTKGRRR